MTRPHEDGRDVERTIVDQLEHRDADGVRQSLAHNVGWSPGECVRSFVRT